MKRKVKWWKNGVHRNAVLLVRDYEDRPQHLDFLYYKLDYRKYKHLWKKNRTISKRDLALIRKYLSKETWNVDWDLEKKGTTSAPYKAIYNRERGQYMHPVAIRQIEVGLRMMHACLRDNRAKKVRFVRLVANNPKEPVRKAYRAVCPR